MFKKQNEPEVFEEPSKLPNPRDYREMGQAFVDYALSVMPDAKPSDWRKVQVALNHANRLGVYWGKKTRKVD